MNITLYHWDAKNVYTHATQADPAAPLPLRCTLRTPPVTTGSEVAAWRNNGWVVLPERPVPPEPDPQPEPVPQSVTRAQGKAALITAGLWQSVVDYVAAIADPTEKALAEVALNDTLEWLRTSPFLNAAAAALGITPEQLDNLFRLGATFEL